MSTQFTNRQWRLPNNENKDKQSNYSMDFDGGSSYIIVPTNDSFAFGTGGFTINTWVNFPTDSGQEIILEFRSGGYKLWKQPDETILWVKGSLVVQTTTSLSLNTWHLVTVLNTGSSTSIYIDGNLASSVVSDTASYSASNLYIGKFEYGGYAYRGKMDAVSIFNYALSSSQVTTLYGSSSTGIGNPMSLSPAPVAYYPLGDQDSFNGAEYLVPNSSLKDYVFDFDGSNDYIDIVNSSTAPTSLQSLGNSNSYSISSWINTTTTDTYSALWFAGKTILEMRNEGTTGIHVPFNLSVSSGKLFFGRSSNYTTSYENYSSTTDVNTGSWVHCIATVDNNTLKFYINGSLDSTHTFTTATGDCSVGSNTSNFFIGSRSTDGGGNDAYFDGSLSNAQIFNSALSATGSNSVETLYNNGSPLTSMSGFTSLQGWWKLDASATYDGSDWTIPDDSSNSNDGTSSGMTQANLVQSDLSFTSGYSPYALDFDGVNDYIDLGTYSQGTGLALNANMSISAWIKTSNLSSIQVVICNLNSNASSGGYGIEMNRLNNGQYGILYNGATVGLQGSTILSSNTWYHIVMTRTGTSGNWSYNLYLNGNADGSATNVTQDFGNGGVAIGRFGAYNFGYFNGSISNVSVWNAGLTSSQVTEIYNEGVPSNLNNHSAYSNLVSWWQLGSNSSFNTNWTVLDEKGSNNGTSVNMIESDITDGVNSYANGLSSGMGGDEIVGDAFGSSANSLSVNMDVLDRTEDTPS
jgi:hypothetical protein